MSRNESKAKQYEKKAAKLMAYDGTDGPGIPQDELHRRRWINDIVKISESSSVPPIADLPKRRFRAVSFAVAASLAVCAIGAAIFLIKTKDGPSPRIEKQAVQKISRVAMITGEVRNATNTLLTAAQSFQAGDRIVTREGGCAIHLAGGVIVYIDAHSTVTLTRPNTHPASLFLAEGKIVAAVDKHKNGTVAFVVTTQSGRMEVTGTLFAVEAKKKRVDLRVLEGTVRANTLLASKLEISAGQGISMEGRAVRSLKKDELSKLIAVEEKLAPFRSKRLFLAQDRELNLPPLPKEQMDSPPVLVAVVERGPVVQSSQTTAASETKRGESTTSPKSRDLIAEARQQRKARDWEGAIKTYQEIVAKSQNPSETGVALTALGDIYLTYKNAPQSALGFFERYLEKYSRGPLAQEAAFGRIRALRKLGRTQDEINALKQFITAFPNAVQTKLAKQRLSKLESTPSTE